MVKGILLEKRTVILHKLWMKYESHQENQKNYALDTDQELSQVILKMLHFKHNFSLKKFVVSCNYENKNIMLFLVAISEREFPVSVRNTKISSVRCVSHSNLTYV